MLKPEELFLKTAPTIPREDPKYKIISRGCFSKTFGGKSKLIRNFFNKIITIIICEYYRKIRVSRNFLQLDEYHYCWLSPSNVIARIHAKLKLTDPSFWGTRMYANSLDMTNSVGQVQGRRKIVSGGEGGLIFIYSCSLNTVQHN